MSCIWQETSGGWRSLPLPPGATLAGEGLGVPGVAWHGLAQGAERGAALLVRPGVWVRVNGRPVLGGLRMLGHADEVLAESSRFFFSVESAPQVVVFRVPEGGRAPICPVCRGPIKDGSTAVQCPGCGRWFHQGEAEAGRPGKPCWTYAAQCRFCNHPTAFAAEASWRPDREESDV
jgi:hypothetical protein